MVNKRFRFSDLDDDLAFVKRIMANDRDAVAYFLETYSKPLMEYIGRSILKLMPLPVYRPRGGDSKTTRTRQELEQFDEYSYGIGCYGVYYEFIAAMFKEISKQPQWDKLGYYVENPRSRFYTYLSVITTRYFLKHHPDRVDSKSAQNDSDDVSSYDENERLYLMLCLKLQDKDEEMAFSEDMYQELELARTMLKERDAKIIELACFSSLSSTEIAEQMKDEFETAPSAMSKKDLQTRISQWKNRALVRLSGIITADKNKHLFPCILEYVKSKKL